MDIVTGFVADGAVYASYLKQAYRFAQQSKDPSTQVGCVIVNPTMGVIAGSANNLPDSIRPTPEMLSDPIQKGIYIEHAERNAIYKCSQSVLSSKGCHAYVTLSPCLNCARGLIQAGITKVIAHKEMVDIYLQLTHSEEHKKSIEIGWRMLKEAGVNCVLWSGRVFQAPTLYVRVKGHQWAP